ncbi:TlpA disulfide reductase family protein [Gramella sp. AN32]|uniref:Redoxin domain-containing protein n=1 Tax=Christiangramia antarctica TaxID=2058158 RepID=A0ABW5X0Z0_9FLAO|nr:TlpA disulfide reductase family protein [Gramella sp. AN32]MCM4157139.1 peroxiredoxin [Gramella sp. AN32]
MRNIAMFFMLSLLILTGCEDDKGYYIKGNAEGIENGKKVTISEIDPQSRSQNIVDSTTIKDGEFEIDLAEVEIPNLNFLQIEGMEGMVIFISENEKLEFNINKDSIRGSSVSGGPENDNLKKYLAHVTEFQRKMNQIQMDGRQAMIQKDSTKLATIQETQKELLDNDKNLRTEMFGRNKDSFVGVMILTDLLSMRTQSTAEMREMYSELSERMKETPLAKSLEEALNKMGATEVGSKAPDFTGPTPQGEKIALHKNLGKVTIIDFWASWCKPCRVENPNLVKTYNKYKDQGLQIISVSLDRQGQKEKWVQAIADDNLEQWMHVSNLQFWQDPIARSYQIEAIPAMFVLDENGVIVARNLRGESLDAKIGELIQG